MVLPPGEWVEGPGLILKKLGGGLDRLADYHIINDSHGAGATGSGAAGKTPGIGGAGGDPKHIYQKKH
jgi:hypothetical protein